MGLEARMLRQSSCMMVIEPSNRNAGSEHGQKSTSVDFERDVKHCHRVVWLSCDASKKGDVALDAGYKRRGTGVDEPELLQCAQPVGVAVEGVVE